MNCVESNLVSASEDNKLSLDELIYEMETVHQRRSPMNGESGVFSASSEAESAASSEVVTDVYQLLAQKERDLVLAAELGKALLDKNEELSKANERIAEEFSAKLEELEQEKYHLRRRLEAAEEEYDIRVLELQNDITSLKATLEEQNSISRQSDREKSLLITTLTEQNQRLTNQLKESSKHEESLLMDLQTLKNQVSMKRSSMNDHVSHLDMLRDEINLLTERKLELEKRIYALQGEREGLSTTLDESADRIVMLEKQSREQDSIIRTNEKTMEELQTANMALSDRLESMYRSLSLSPQNGNVSLLNEMEVSDSERSMAHHEDELDIECDDETVMRFNHHSKEIQELKDEILSTYHQLKTFCGQLRQREKLKRNSGSSDSLNDGESSSISSEGEVEVKVGLLNSIVQELRGLLHDILRKESKGACLSCGGDANEKIRLEIQAHKTKENLEKLERLMKQREEEAKRKDEEILELKSKLSVTEVKLSAALEERDTLKEDLQQTGAGKDELIRKAWDVRDAAVKRKNNTEIELARTRIDVMQVNSQLLESIRQKVELSKQLEQWQVDMEELLEEQMMKKMKAHERPSHRSGNDSDSSSTDRKKSNKILAFFQRAT